MIKYIFKNIGNVATIILCAGLFASVLYVVLLFTNHYLNFSGILDLDNGSKIAPVFGSVIGIFFSLAGTLLIIENLRLTRVNQNSNELLTQKNQFESVFFALLNLHRDILITIDSTHYSHKNNRAEPYKGVKFFDAFSAYITNDFKSNVANHPQSLNTLVALYNQQYNIHSSDLGHYFRHLYHIIRFVDTNPYFTSIHNTSNSLYNKSDYIKILRAQLSNSEIVLLALNGLTATGKEFKKYLVQYELLKNINFEIDLAYGKQCHVPAPEILTSEFPYLLPIYKDQQKDMKT